MQAAAAARVFDLARGQATVEELLELISGDVALSARLLRMANSAHYGAPQRVASVSHAAVLLGGDTVRALAVSTACGLLDHPGEAGPPGFDRHAASTAAATGVVAERVGYSRAEGFTVGLLHDLGLFLLHRRDPGKATQARNAPSTSHQLTAELRAFGLTHAQAGAAALEAWSFPTAMVEAVASHHGSDEPRHTLGRLLRVGEALATTLEPTDDHPGIPLLERLLPGVGLPLSAATDLLDEVERDLDRMVRTLEGAS
jgi:putative nucleotidyltransferase with HDIG domain